MQRKLTRAVAFVFTTQREARLVHCSLKDNQCIFKSAKRRQSCLATTILFFFSLFCKLGSGEVCHGLATYTMVEVLFTWANTLKTVEDLPPSGEQLDSTNIYILNVLLGHHDGLEITKV